MVGRWLTDLADTAAFVFAEVEDLNWAGFYLYEDGVLALGPFQGRPAWTTISLDRGVCGQAARERKVLVVPDVDSPAPGRFTEADEGFLKRVAAQLLEGGRPPRRA